PAFRGFDLLVTKGKIEVHLVNKFPDNAIKVVTKDSLPTNVWHHVFVTYDGSKTAAGAKVYVDGKSRPLDTANDKLSATITNAVPLLIGARLKAFPFNGLIDDVRLYNRPLKSEEVADLAAYRNPPIPQVPPANRLTLARWLVSTNNPLTARVTVNRYWTMVFGTGLVKTSNDFGSQGDRPSHPELLDWLACEFMQPQGGVEALKRLSVEAVHPGQPATPSASTLRRFNGSTLQPWSIKHILRLMF